MKKVIFLVATFACTLSMAQEHFTGLTNSSRVGVLTVGNNPAEILNMSNRFEFNLFGMSVNSANNKVGFKDITSDKNIEDLIFTGSEPVNMRVNAEIYGPSVAVNLKKWGFGLYTKANLKLDIIDVDTKLGDAINNANAYSILSMTPIKNDYNQRLSGTVWGEVGITAARNFVNSLHHKFNAGVTFKILMPGAYANMGLDKFNGTITNSGGTAYLTNTQANMNIAYSGNLANNFSNVSDYTSSIFGNINGFAGDVGINYQYKKDSALIPDKIEEKVRSKYKNKYLLNLGLSVKNIGSMTFKDNNNSTTNYALNTQPNALNPNPLGLDLSLFQNADGLKDVENILLQNGYLTKVSSNQELKVKLPTTINAYADVKVISKLYVSAYWQQKVNKDSENDQITAQNIFTVTPRINLGFFEAYVPLSNTEVAGFTGGFGIRLGGFYIGSGSILTALTSDTKQADIYTGFRWAFL